MEERKRIVEKLAERARQAADWSGIVVVVALGLIVYPIVTHYLMVRYACKANLSSFVEASIAFNSAMLFSNVRRWFVDKFRRANTKYRAKAVNVTRLKRTDASIEQMATELKKLERPLSHWLIQTSHFFSRLCFVEIVVGCALLLFGWQKDENDEGLVNWLPMLLWAFVCFFAFMEAELLVAKRRARIRCRSFIEDARTLSAAREDTDAEIKTFKSTVPTKKKEK